MVLLTGDRVEIKFQKYVVCSRDGKLFTPIFRPFECDRLCLFGLHPPFVFPPCHCPFSRRPSLSCSCCLVRAAVSILQHGRDRCCCMSGLYCAIRTIGNPVVRFWRTVGLRFVFTSWLPCFVVRVFFAWFVGPPFARPWFIFDRFCSVSSFRAAC